MLKFFNRHNVRQHSPANINSYELLATFTNGAGRLSKRRSKRRSVNPALANSPERTIDIVGLANKDAFERPRQTGYGSFNCSLGEL